MSGRLWSRSRSTTRQRRTAFRATRSFATFSWHNSPTSASRQSKRWAHLRCFSPVIWPRRSPARHCPSMAAGQRIERRRGVMNRNDGRRPKVVIVGGGFGGLSATHALRSAAVDVTVIDRHNYHLFQPLLYQVATASLSPADIAQPIRSILKDQANARVLLGTVTGIDLVTRQVLISRTTPAEFDYLVIATGARHSYFGKDHWAVNAPGIKSIDDATRVRGNVLMAFERAEVETDPERRRALLTFVIVGGGATGVELAGAIAELARNSITNDFRSITPHCARVVLVEAGPRLLPAMPDSLSEETRLALERLGVEVRLGTAVTDISRHKLVLGSEMIDARTIIWAAGVRASVAGEW